MLPFYFSLFLLFAYIGLPLPALAQIEDEQETAFITMFSDRSVVSATRSAKPLSQAAENITIITADDIKLSGAHTLADVLNNITGVQVLLSGGPGNVATASLQGSEARQVTIVIDGVVINNLSDNTVDISTIPVQNIERIEMIKGPASSSWGSALGGVINIITKSADTTKRVKGSLSASWGERSTLDDRAEVLGKLSHFGYYFYAGTFHSDGFRPNNTSESNNVYAKFDYHINNVSDVILTLSYTKGNRGLLEQQSYGLDAGDGFNYLRSSLSFNTRVADSIDVDLSLHALQQKRHQDFSLISTGQNILSSFFNDTDLGGTIKASWKSDTHNIVLGGDYDSGVLRSNDILGGKRRLDKTAVFINDTVTFGQLTITPGLRYDDTNTNGDFVSPSFGATYKLGEAFLLRADAARGFNVPPLAFTFGNGTTIRSNPNLKVEKVTSYQAGVETTAIPYLNLKVMLFHHSVTNAIDYEPITATTTILVNRNKVRRQGVESEISTVPVYNISLTAGVALIGSRNINANTTIPNIPQYTYDFGIKYIDNSLKALVKGHYIWWNARAADGGKYNAFIIDANISKVLLKRMNNVWEIFFGANNIFNGSQYALGVYDYKNPRRWVESGVRVSF